MRMSYCREIFETHLRYSGIESETVMVNLLVGRISPEIFQALLVSKYEAGY